MPKVEEIRNQVNQGHWDLIKKCTDKLLLVQTFLQFVRSLSKPVFSNDELTSLGDISVSSVMDNVHMGFITIIADFIGTVIYDSKSKPSGEEINN